MEGAPGLLSGPPEARPGEDGACGSRSRGRSPAGGLESLGRPPPQGPLRALPPHPLPLLAPPLGGVPRGAPRDPKGAAGGRVPRRRQAPDGDEGGPCPKSPRGAPEMALPVGAGSGRSLPLSVRGAGGAPGSPRSSQSETGLTGAGQSRAWRSLRGASPRSGLQGAPPRSGLRGASPRSGLRGASPRSGLRGASPRSLLWGAPPRSGLRGAPPWSLLWGAPPRSGLRGAPPWSLLWGAPPRSGLRGASPRSGLRGASPWSLLWGAPPRSGLQGAPPWSLLWGAPPRSGLWGAPPQPPRFRGCELPRSEAGPVAQSLLSLGSQNHGVRAGPSEPPPIQSAADSGLAHSFSDPGFLAGVESEFIPETENNLKRIRQFLLSFHLSTASEKHDPALLLLVAFVSTGRDASLRPRRTLAPKGNQRGRRYMESANMGTSFLHGILVSTQQKHFPGSSGTNCFLPIESRFLETDNLVTVFARDNLTGLSVAFLRCLNELPKWKFRKLKMEKNSHFLKKENGIRSVEPKKRRRNTVHLLLTAFKTSNFAFSLKYECNKVRGNYVSQVSGTCHIITTENMHNDFKKYTNSLHVIPKDTFFSVFDAFDKVPLLSDLDDSGSISLSKRYYNNNKSSEKAINLEALDALAMGHTPQFIQYSQINTTEHFHKTNTYAQSIVIEKKQIFNVSGFNFKGKFNCFLDTEQQVKLVNYDSIFVGPDTMIKTWEEFVENSLNEGKGKMQDLIWSERKHPTENLTGIHNYQIANGNKTEREQKCNIIISTVADILNPNLLMKKKPNLEDAREIDQILENQDTTDRNEHQTILQESALANSKLFHPNIESTEFVNNEFKTDLATRNNEHSPVLPAECLSTEIRTSDFEMKREFDIVLKELLMFHEIGKEEETSCIAETRSNEEKNDFDKDNSMEIEEDLTVVSEKICALPLPCDTITSVPNVPKTVQSSFKWKKIHTDGVKEEPHEYCSSSPSDDEVLSPSGKDFEKALSQSPALFSDTFVEERIHSLSKGGSSLSHGIVRVHPLKTCRGPIRIGLSRKAKPKQLHPYLK